MNLLPGRVVGAGRRRDGRRAHRLRPPMPSMPPTGREVEVGIRPEDLRFAAGGDGALAFAKDFVEELGATRLFHGTSGDAPLVVAVAAAEADEGGHRRHGRCFRRAPFDPASGNSLRTARGQTPCCRDENDGESEPWGLTPSRHPSSSSAAPTPTCGQRRPCAPRAEELGIPPSSTICTGDVVAYCAEPEETTAARARLGLPRHRRQLRGAARRGRRGLRLRLRGGHRVRSARQGLVSLRQRALSPASRAWMAALPKTLTFTSGGLRFRVIHGGVDLINRFVFASERDVLAEELDASRRRRGHRRPRRRAVHREESAGAPGSIPASSACRPTTAPRTSGTA